MDISAATTLAAGIVALVAPALIQTFKKYIPADYVGLTSLGVPAFSFTVSVVRHPSCRVLSRWPLPARPVVEDRVVWWTSPVARRG